VEAQQPQSDPLIAGGFETLCAHYGEHRLAHGGGAAPPIYQTSTFVFPDAEAFEIHNEPQSPYYLYTRKHNPTAALLEAKLARIEHGDWARVFASGMGALCAALHVRLAAQTHIVAVTPCYAHGYLKELLPRFGVETTFLESGQPADVVAALRDNTRVLYFESPSGSSRCVDIAALAALARERGILTVHDNTWATPYFQNPLDYGVDLVVHSASKYLGGHSDLVAGVVVGRDEELRRDVFREAEALGATLDPFAAWLLLRGLRTLAIRMEQHQRSGLAVARMLAAHPKVENVQHCGLEGHPSHALAARQLRGYAGVFWFTLRDASRAAALRFLNRLRLFSIGVSWGGFESLAVGGPWRQEDSQPPRWVMRLHAGLESTDDLLNDVRQALED